MLFKTNSVIQFALACKCNHCCYSDARLETLSLRLFHQTVLCSLQALKHAHAVLLVEPTHVKALYKRGLALVALGSYENAVTALTAAAKADPQNATIRR